MTQNLPKLPWGKGSYDYIDADCITIRYRKQYKGKTISVCGTSITDVNRKMREKEAELSKLLEKKDKKLQSKNESLRFQEDMEKWLYSYKRANLKQERSFDRVESTFYVHIYDTDLGCMKTNEITSDDIQEFMSELYNHKNEDEELSYSSKAKVYDLLSQYFYHLSLLQHSPYSNPMLIVPRPKNKNKKEDMLVYSDDEMEEFTRTCIFCSKNKHAPFIAFIMWTYLRVGEALALRWKDIDIENGILHVHDAVSLIKNRTGEQSIKKYIKKLTGAKYDSRRTIKMCDLAIKCIKVYKDIMNPQSEDWFCTADSDILEDILSPNSTNRILHIIQKEAKLSKKLSIHGLRHSGISYMLRHKMPVEVVSKMAGHKSIQITMDIYYTVLEEQKIKAIENIDSDMKCVL